MYQPITLTTLVARFLGLWVVIAIAGCASRISNTQLAVETVRSTILAGTVDVANFALVVVDTSSLSQAGLIDPSARTLLASVLEPRATLSIPSISEACTKTIPSNCIIFTVERYKKTMDGVIITGKWISYNRERRCYPQQATLRFRRDSSILRLMEVVSVELSGCSV